MNTTNKPWLFNDPRNVAVFTTTQIFRQGRSILRVSHDDADGAWQFHTGSKHVASSDIVLVALEEIVNLDPTVCALADLPCGWIAERDHVGGPWRRAQKQETLDAS